MTTSKRNTELSIIILILLISSVAGCTSSSTNTPKETPNTTISVKTAYNMINNNYTDIPNLTFYLDWKIVYIFSGRCSMNETKIGNCDSWFFNYEGIILYNNSYQQVTTQRSVSFKKNVPSYPLDRINQYSPYETVILRARTIPLDNLTEFRDDLLNISIDIESINDSTWAGLTALGVRGNLPKDYVETGISIRLTASATGKYYSASTNVVVRILSHGETTWFFQWRSRCKDEAPFDNPCPHTDKVIVDAKTGYAIKIR